VGGGERRSNVDMQEREREEVRFPALEEEVISLHFESRGNKN